jgi:hypothetical protein
MRYFDGTSWTQHWQQPLQAQERMERLDGAVADLMGRRFDVRVESRTPFQVVLVYGKNMGAGHVVFALLSIFTCGLFLIPWIIVAGSSGERRQVMTIDQYGTVK